MGGRVKDDPAGLVGLVIEMWSDEGTASFGVKMLSSYFGQAGQKTDQELMFQGPWESRKGAGCGF